MPLTFFPNSGQSLGQTRATIRQNFVLTNNTFNQNHVDFTAMGAGKHFVCQFPTNGVVPAGGFVAGDANLYGRALNAESQLVFKPDASTNQYQMTRSVEASFGSFAALVALTPPQMFQSAGWTFLPGGLLLQYGFYNNPNLGSSGFTSGQITFQTPYTSPPLGIFMNLVGTSSSNQSMIVNTGTLPTTTTFNWRFSGGSGSFTGFYWVAIGK